MSRTVAILLTASIGFSSTVGIAGQSTLVHDSVHSPGLASSVLGDSPTRSVEIYLPPSYRADSTRRYPVLYLLHGATSAPVEWLDGTYQGLNLQTELDALIASRAIPELIVVMPDADNKLGAGFYANSPATGNWEDFVVRDLVRHVDRQYRTDARGPARALVGHSMGGFGALAIAFKHPDMFGLVYAVSPCCMGFVGRLAPTGPAWPALAAVTRWQDAPPQLNTIIGMAAALDGNAGNPRLFDGLPFRAGPDGTIVPDPDVQARWLAKMPPDLAAAMVKRGARAPVLFMEAGTEESGILEGIKYLRDRLDSLGIRYTDVTFNGGHIDRVRERLSRHVLPAVGQWLSRR